MNKKLKDIIDNKTLGTRINDIKTHFFFKNYDWSDFFSNTDNFLYAFNQLDSDNLIHLLNKTDDNKIQKFLNANPDFYNSLLLTLINKNNTKLGEYFYRIKSFPRVSFIDSPYIESESAKANPFVQSIFHKNAFFMEKLISYKVENDTNRLKQKKSQMFNYFIRNVDIEGVKFMLDNGIAAYSNSRFDKENEIVFSKAFKNINKSFYDTNKQKINEIITLIFNDFTKRETYYSLVSSRSEQVESKAENNEIIIINDLFDEVYPPITGDILEKFSSIYKMQKNFRIESFQNKRLRIDMEAYDGYGIFDKENDTQLDALWSMLKLYHGDKIKDNYVMLYLLCQLESLKTDENYVNKSQLNGFINQNMHLIEEFKDTTVILSEKIHIQNAHDQIVYVALNHPTLAVSLNRKDYLETVFNPSPRNFMDKLAPYDFYCLENYDLLNEYSLYINSKNYLNFYQKTEDGILPFFSLTERIEKNRDKLAKRYVDFFMKNWQTLTINDINIPNMINKYDLSLTIIQDQINEKTEEIINDNSQYSPKRRALLMSKLSTLKNHLAEGIAESEKRVLTTVVVANKVTSIKSRI